MDSYLKVEVDSYGFYFSSAQVYFSLSWLAIVLGVIGFIGWKLYRKWKSAKVKPMEVTDIKETIDLWS